MRAIVFKIPEYYLLIFILLAGYSPPFSINPVFAGLAVVVILQIIFKKRLPGLVIGGLFLLANIFFLGALISEFIEFTEFSTSAIQLLLVGVPLWLLNTAVSILMIYKNISNSEEFSLKSRLKEIG